MALYCIEEVATFARWSMALRTNSAFSLCTGKDAMREEEKEEDLVYMSHSIKHKRCRDKMEQETRKNFPSLCKKVQYKFFFRLHRGHRQSSTRLRVCIATSPTCRVSSVVSALRSHAWQPGVHQVRIWLLNNRISCLAKWHFLTLSRFWYVSSLISGRLGRLRRRTL